MVTSIKRYIRATKDLTRKLKHDSIESVTKINKGNKKMSKQKKINKESAKVTFIGMLQLLTVISISYMAYVVIIGTDGVAPKVMTIPAIIWAANILIKKFIK